MMTPFLWLAENLVTHPPFAPTHPPPPHILINQSLISYMGQNRSLKPLKALIRKYRDRVPPTKCSGATFQKIKTSLVRENPNVSAPRCD